APHVPPHPAHRRTRWVAAVPGTRRRVPQPAPHGGTQTGPRDLQPGRRLEPLNPRIRPFGVHELRTVVTEERNFGWDLAWAPREPQPAPDLLLGGQAPELLPRRRRAVHLPAGGEPAGQEPGAPPQRQALRAPGP